MRESLARNPSVLVSMVRQLRSSKRGDASSYLMVEGPGDRNLYGAFCDSSCCTPIVAFGKDGVLEVVSLAQTAHVCGVVGIADADCHRLLPRGPIPAGVVLTDGHDLEALMLNSPALEKVLAELGDADLISTFQEAHGPIRTQLIEWAMPLGIVKLLKAQGQFRRLNITPGKLEYSRMFDLPSVSAPLRSVVAEVLRCSIDQALPSADDVVASIEGVEQTWIDPWQIVRGHDMVGLLAVALRQCFGARGNVTTQSVEQALRLAYDSLCFARSSLCGDIGRLEDEQPKYHYLHPDVRLALGFLKGT